MRNDASRSGHILLWTLYVIVLLFATIGLLGELGRLDVRRSRETVHRIEAWYLAVGAALEADDPEAVHIDETPLDEFGSLRTDLERLGMPRTEWNVPTMSLRRSVVVTAGMTVVVADVVWSEGCHRRTATCRLPLSLDDE